MTLQSMPVQTCAGLPDSSYVHAMNRQRIARMLSASVAVEPHDPAGLYLRANGLEAAQIMAMGRALRFAPALDYWEKCAGVYSLTGTHPGLLALLSGNDDEGPTLPPQLLRIYLTEGGELAPVSNPFKRTGAHALTRGAAVRLGSPALINGAWRLAVTVGLPEALRVARCTGLPVWAVFDVTELAALCFPKGKPLRFLHTYTDQTQCHHVAELVRKAHAFEIWADVRPMPASLSD